MALGACATPGWGTPEDYCCCCGGCSWDGTGVLFVASGWMTTLSGMVGTAGGGQTYQGLDAQKSTK